MPLIENLSHANMLAMFGGVFILIGCLFIYPAIKHISEDIGSRTWPSAVAMLQDIEVMKTIYEDNEKAHYRRFVSYGCRLEYAYSVNGQTYSAVMHEAAAGEEEATALSQSHKKGETLPIYYNPKKPETYRFTRDITYNNLMWLLPVFGFTGFGTLIIFMSRKFF